VVLIRGGPLQGSARSGGITLSAAALDSPAVIDRRQGRSNYGAAKRSHKN